MTIKTDFSQCFEMLKRLIPEKRPVLLVGSPGIGKSTIYQDLADFLQWEIFSLHLVYTDFVDVKGLPIKTGEKTADFIPIGALKILYEANKPTLFILEDLIQALPAIQALAMPMILDREINGKKISDFIYFAAATNKGTDFAGGSTILEPVKSRFNSIIFLEPDIKSFTKYMLKKEFDYRIISFLQLNSHWIEEFKPTKTIQPSNNPRTIEFLNDQLTLFADVESELLPQIVTGCQGEQFAIEFLAFCKRLEALPDLNEILQSGKTDFDFDILYFICLTLLKKLDAKNQDLFLNWVLRLDPEFQSFFFSSAKQAEKDLTNSAQYARFVVSNQEYEKF